ncbi:MAG: glycosyl transferase family 1 [Hyphomicrobiales bacterium]|nr:MAG: glycosyl transferase family 1 [Hyphomicrobiales bacterium]
MGKKIIFVHLLNDFSGSPKVLAQVISSLKSKNNDLELYVGNDDGGFLSDLGIDSHNYRYKRFGNKILTLFSYIWSQARLFVALLKYRKQDIVIYINTMLPFGAAIAGMVLRKPVYYHIHETSIRPHLLKKFLRKIISISAVKIIFVSRSLEKTEAFKGVNQRVIYNSLPREFIEKADNFALKLQPASDQFVTLLICSLKKYKGVDEFVQIAKKCEIDKSLKFHLILNATQVEIDAYFESQNLPSNLTLYGKQTELHSFYQSADLLLNLSLKDQWVETFGLTILEAMAYGLPCIVPQSGGPTELIENDINGYQIDAYNVDEISNRIIELSKNEKLLKKLSFNAREKCKVFDPSIFELQIIDLFNNK